MAAPRMTKDDMPQSLGAFKPVDHVVIALPDDDSAARLAQALRGAGFEEADVLEYSAAEKGHAMSRMLEHTSEFAGFGYEVSLMRRYQELARKGASWLIVYAPDEARTAQVAELAKAHGALVAEKYETLTIESLVV
jgi:hypothetical protein